MRAWRTSIAPVGIERWERWQAPNVEHLTSIAPVGIERYCRKDYLRIPSRTSIAPVGIERWPIASMRLPTR